MSMLPKTAHVEHVQRSLGRRIRELRSKRGWTQEQFAEFCGVHRTYMGHVERGEKNVSLSTVLRVANALGVRIPSLFGMSAGPADPQPMSVSGKRLSSPNVDRLLDELQSQRDAMRRALRELSRFVHQIHESPS